MSQDRNQPLVMPATLEECEEVMERLSADCNRIRDQLDDAVARKNETGVYADPRWYRRATSALRWMNRDRQRLQDHMGKLRKAQKTVTTHLEDKALIAALREHVSPAIFQACVDRARLQVGGEA